MKRSLFGPFLVVLGLLLALAACGGGASSNSTSGGAGPMVANGTVAGQPARAVPAQGGSTGAGSTADSVGVPPVPPVPSDKLIRTAQVTLEVSSGRFDDTLNRLVALTSEEGGFVSSSQASTAEDVLREGVFTFSVPSDRFEATIGSLRDLGKVQAENISSQDVGAQYTDLQARLKNAEAQRDAMLALLQQAKSVSDIIAVQNQLGQITGAIEQLKGQINYLDHATAYSTITVTLREAGVVAAPPSDTASLRDALATGFHAFVLSLAAVLVVLVAIGPYVLLAGLFVFGWAQRRRFSRTGTR
jgi:uncharacterized protein DUF4349